MSDELKRLYAAEWKAAHPYPSKQDVDASERFLQALASLESQNQALQEALAFYAEPRNHEWQQIEHENGERYTKASSLVDEDAGARARDALSQETEAE